MVKVCPKCDQKSVVKNWMKRWKQAYKCGLCYYRFIGKSRDRWESSTVARLWRDYIEWKQTYKQIWDKLWKDKRTVQRMFDKEIVRTNEFYNEKLNKIAIIITWDCTWFGDTGFIIIKSHEHRKVIYAKALGWEENIKEYVDAINYLKDRWRIIKWVVCDWLKWLRQALEGIPFQTCQFHQVKNIVKYLTKKPKNEASKWLLRIAYELKSSTYEEFEEMLGSWYESYGKYVNEKTYSDTWKKKRRYTHSRLRSAYKSLKNNMCVLFTYKMYDGMPNTTNELDWYFKLIKAKTNIHNGLEEERKKRVVLSLFSI